MRNAGARRAVLISLVLSVFASAAVAVIVKQTVRYDRPVREIRGRVTAVGQVMDAEVWVDVYDNAQVCLDNSIAPVEQRKRQTKVASVEPNYKGEFSIKHLPRGFYEVEVGNHGGGGYHVLSVLVNIDPKWANDKLCVDLSLEGGNSENTIARCGAK